MFIVLFNAFTNAIMIIWIHNIIIHASNHETTTTNKMTKCHIIWNQSNTAFTFEKIP